MFGSIKYNLTHLFDFTGRDARQTFWYYILFLVVIEFSVSIAMSVPLMVNIFSQILAAAKAGVTDQQAIQNMMAARMGGWLQHSVRVSMVLSLVVIVLFVAAFVRRLHDSDKSGWWAALPIATKLFSMAMTFSVMGRMQEMITTAMKYPEAGGMLQYQREMAPYGLLSWIGYIVVIVFGIMKSTDGPNRYGAAPVRF
jgi:uncharacterized membrane protein YhaH (DUF805 family)